MAETVVPVDIGRGLRRDPRLAALAVALAAAVIAVDMAVVDPSADLVRLALGLGAGAVLLLLSGGDRRSLGLTWSAAPSWRRWIKWTLLLGLIVAAFVAIVVAGALLLGIDVSTEPVYRGVDLSRLLIQAVVIAPLVEEPIYRLVLCAPLAATIGKWPTIIAGGAIFGALHFLYGNPGPDNFVAGYVLTWAYLRSGTMVMPIALHAAGNLCVWLGNVAYLYAYAS